MAPPVTPELFRRNWSANCGDGWTGDLFEDTNYYKDLIDLETGLCTSPEKLRRG